MAFHDIARGVQIPETNAHVLPVLTWRYHLGSSVATGLLKLAQISGAKKPDKEKSSNLQILPKLTPKCCIILH